MTRTHASGSPAGLLVLAVMALAMIGCESRVSLGARCDSTTLCPSPLVCGVGGVCRVECLTSAQCPVGERCLVDVSVGIAACSIARETCTSDCAQGLECVAGECQSRCTTDTDCPDGECLATGVCRAIASGADAGPPPDAFSFDGGASEDAPVDASSSPCGVAPEVLDVDVGLESACALTMDGSAYCWGYYGVVGPVGESGPCSARSGCFPRPRRITGLPPLSQIAVGGNLACGISSEAATLGEVWCWGEVDFMPAAPHPITLADRTTRIHASLVDAGRTFACAVTSEATPRVLCWGDQDHGVLGNGVSVVGMAINTAVVATELGTPDRGGLALSSIGTFVRAGQSVRAVGANDDSEVTTPDSVNEVNGVERDLGGALTGLAATADNACALVGTTPHCWGRYGTLTHPPVEPAECLSGAACTNEATIFTGPELTTIVGDPYGDAVFGWDDTGTVFGWGSSYGSILAEPNLADIEPLTALGGALIADAAIGDHSACAILRSSNQLVCWGLNDDGQLGRGEVDGDAHAVAAPLCW